MSVHVARHRHAATPIALPADLPGWAEPAPRPCHAAAQPCPPCQVHWAAWIEKVGKLPKPPVTVPQSPLPLNTHFQPLQGRTSGGGRKRVSPSKVKAIRSTGSARWRLAGAEHWAEPRAAPGCGVGAGGMHMHACRQRAPCTRPPPAPGPHLKMKLKANHLPMESSWRRAASLPDLVKKELIMRPAARGGGSASREAGAMLQEW